VIKIDMLLHQE